jgi:peptidoglycan/xylan/chitin deacetylase (PgdA/CDA1 family)
MAAYRDFFFAYTGKFAKLLPLRPLHALTGQKLIFPLYHTVSDLELPHIRHLYPVKDSRTFIRDLDFLLKRYKALDNEELKKIILYGEKPRKPSFFLTFDDGLREFYEIVAPILLAKGIPAINFLNSSFVDNRDLFFRYKVSLILDRLNTKQLSSHEKKALDNWTLKNFGSTSQIREKLINLRYGQKHLLDEMATLIQINFSDFLDKHRPYLSSDEIRSLQAQGFLFGAHSMDHPEYRFLPEEEQIRQTRESSLFLSENFGTENRIFSFPFTDYGVSRNFFETVYRPGDSLLDFSFGCAGLKKEDFPRHRQRIPFEKGRMEAREIISAELLYFLLKSAAGKNRTIRK